MARRQWFAAAVTCLCVAQQCTAFSVGVGAGAAVSRGWLSQGSACQGSVRARVSVAAGKDPEPQSNVGRGTFVSSAVSALVAATVATSMPQRAMADLPQGRSVPLDRREAARGPPGVNNPDLLPQGPKTNVIDLERMLTSGEVKRINNKIEKLEQDKGYRLRVLTQSYPNTPGLAIKDYWGVNENTIVMVVDRGTYRGAGAQTANILNFNVGDGVSLDLPPIFFTRLRNLYGVKKFVSEQGEDRAIEGAVDSIVSCLRQDGGCSEVPEEFKAIALNKPF
uniref:TPM domain-containing protein n=1 Tax=Rhizochromulina marina TaxID=1034831 RepID=A0A7S2RH44_9STRA